MSIRIAGGSLIVLALAIGCVKQPEVPVAEGPKVVVKPQPASLPGGPEVAPMPRPKLPAVAKWVPGTKDEQARLVAHIPEPIRKLYGDDANFRCFRDLEGKAFAWEYSGGPVKLWLEFEEKGQSTVPKRYPPKEDWIAKGEKGRIIFWIRRGTSDKINSALKRAGKPQGDTSAVGLGITITSPSAAGYNAAVGYQNPLWYGWKGYSFNHEEPVEEVSLPADVPTTLHTLAATETNAADSKQPRQAKLILKIQRVKPE